MRPFYKILFLFFVFLTFNTSLEASSSGTDIFGDVNPRNAKSLHLGGKNIDDDKAFILASHLKENKEITYIDLNHNNISKKGIAHLADALMGKPITQFHFSWNRIEDEGHMALSKAISTWNGLTHLGVNCTGLKDEGAGALLPALKGKKLHALWFTAGHKMSQENIRLLIRNLDYTQLRHIDFGALELDDKDALFLSEQLKGNKVINVLGLDHNQFTAQGIESLAEALLNKPVTQFHLHGSKIGDEGHRALSEAISTWNDLTHLNVSHTDLGDFGCGALSSVLRKKALHALTFSGKQKISKNNITIFLKHLNYTQLRHMHFEDLGLNDEDARFLGEKLTSNQVISHINFNHNKFTTEGIRMLAAALMNKPVTHFHLHGSPIGDEGHIALSEAIGTWNRLVCLNVNCTDLGDQGAGALLTALRGKKLHSLWFNAEHKISQENIRLLIRNLDYTETRKINFAGLSLNDDDALFLSEQLKSNQVISILDFNHNQFTKKGIKSLTQALLNKPVTQFHLHGSQIGAEGHIALSEAIGTWNGLFRLNVNCTGLGNFGSGALYMSLKNKSIDYFAFEQGNKMEASSLERLKQLKK